MKIIFLAIILMGSLANCAMPFANGFTVRDAFQTANSVRNLHTLSNEGAREEMITEVKNTLRSIQAGAKTQN